MRYYLVSLHTGKRVNYGYWTSKAKAIAAANQMPNHFRVEKGE